MFSPTPHPPTEDSPIRPPTASSQPLEPEPLNTSSANPFSGAPPPSSDSGPASSPTQSQPHRQPSLQTQPQPSQTIPQSPQPPPLPTTDLSPSDPAPAVSRAEPSPPPPSPQQQQQRQPLQPFTPLFTLITTTHSSSPQTTISPTTPITTTSPPPATTTTTSSTSTTTTTTTYHHPTVHYLFSDDADSDLLFTAIPTSNPSRSAERSERALIVDLDPSGTRVASAHSLSPEWAVTGAEVVVAPSWEPEVDKEGERGGEGGLMLRVEGVEGWGRRRVAGTGDGKGEGGKLDREMEMEGEGLEALRERWERGMEELRRVVGRE